MKGLYTAIFAIAAAGFCPSCARHENTAQPAESEKAIRIKIKGSETVRPVIEKIDDAYMAQHPNVFVDYTGGGSNIGLMSFLANEADLIFVSREIQAEEHHQLDKKGSVIDTFAIDGLAVIVNLNNPVKSLSMQQLRDIYSGRIKNWKEVGGADWPIALYSRDISSGTYSFFKDKVLDSLDYAKDDINLTHNEEIVNNVANTKQAIGYVGLSYINKPNIRPVPLVFEAGEAPQAPNFQNIGSNSYRLKRYILLISHTNEKPEVSGFIKVLKQEQSLKVINEVGLIPAKSL